ncbi:MAG: nucleotidyltransferase [Cenarchaeum symbiont of Oopsacas minuta]|nr:nucleotidyltransferase [Cenarchaeum symbiont of Oopsacas minuta]
MNAIVMAGGCGTRMKSKKEKLLLDIDGEAMIIRTVRILSDSQLFDSISCITSANAPETATILENAKIQTISTAGLGYSKDLGEALSHMCGHVLIVSGDMPLLDSHILQRMIKLYDKNSIWTSFVMTRKFANTLDIEYHHVFGKFDYVHTGVMIVNASAYEGENKFVKEDHIILDEKKLGININTLQDYENLISFT